ncbi:MAG TPA: dihydropteroate synthase [Candidatus Saccharimonadales bacterium]|jgi:dihydropteroate synthase|nr:dihydropteroate synthase [Candidatus Saccharimonadales bacterium]
MSAQIMAIINTSLESFSGDGIQVNDEVALEHKIQTALAEGADILDIGGQSTRPNAEIISVQAEIARVVPAIRIARRLSLDIPISIDTFKPEVARAALEAGASILNDVTGFEDERMVQLAAENTCDIVVMHMRGTPQTMSMLTTYPHGVVTEVKECFVTRTNELIAAGIAAQRIIIDPGIGFAKTAAQSYELTHHLSKLKALGFRVLYGASNKSFIGKALAHHDEIAEIKDRAVGTVVVQTCALLGGADIVRAHDVASAVQTRTIVEALIKS